MGKTLLVYFSYEGHVEALAERIAVEIGCSTARLELRDYRGLTGFMKYFKLGWLSAASRSPAIAVFPEHDPAAFDTIVIGSPTWAGNFNPAFRTYFAGRPLAGKRVIAFFSGKAGRPGAGDKLRQFLGLAALDGEFYFHEGGDSNYDVLQKIEKIVAAALQ